jgi:hypothetical protein
MVDGSGELNVGRPERIPEIKQLKIFKKKLENDDFLRSGENFYMRFYILQEEKYV